MAAWLLLPHPDATLWPVQAGTGDHVLELMEAQGRDPDASTLRQFEAYHGVDVWTVENGVGSLCLVVWDRAGSGRLALACAPPGIEAELSLAVEPEGGDGFGDWLRTGSVVDFQLRANSVVVFVRLPPSAARGE